MITRRRIRRGISSFTGSLVSLVCGSERGHERARERRERKREATVVGCDVSTCWKLARRHLRRRVLHPCVDSCVIVAYTQACRDDGIYAGGRKKFPAVEYAPTAGVSRSTRSVFRLWQQQQQQQTWE